MRWERGEGDERVRVRETVRWGEGAVVVRDGSSGEVVERWAGRVEEGGSGSVGVDKVRVSAFGEGTKRVEELETRRVFEVSATRHKPRR